jgi:sugar phosphate isomerase/epimerase
MEVDQKIPELGRLGISSWTYPWAVGTVHDQQPRELLSPQDLVHKAAELRVRVLQIADNLPLSDLTSQQLDSLRNLAHDRGIALQVGTRGIDQSHLLEYLRLAQQLDVKLIRSMGGRPGSAAPLSVIEKNVRAALPAFVDAGVCLALENYEAYSSSDLARLVDAIANPSFGICLDVANSFAAWESVEQILGNLAPGTINVHLKDFAIERTNHLMGFVCVGRPIGKGKLPLELILLHLIEFDRRPDLIVELWPPQAGTLNDTVRLEKAWAEESVSYLQNFLADLRNQVRPDSIEISQL